MSSGLFGIMACDARWGIGFGGKIAWNYSGDIQFYRQKTAGKTLIMGSKTYDSMPEHALANRRIIVFSRHPRKEKKGCTAEFIPSWSDFAALKIRDGAMIGGSQISRLFFEKNSLRCFFLTHILKAYPADVYFPHEFIEKWTRKVISETPDYTIYRYENPTHPNSFNSDS